MKKVLLTSTALVLSAGVAAADVSVGGDGRMGVRDNFNGDLEFSSRIRISFAASGETDGGLAFGGSIRADNAGGASCGFEDSAGLEPGDPGYDSTTGDITCSGTGGVAGLAGSVFVEGAFGKLSMGDVDGAARSAVGHVSGVGYTALGDLNESTYIANAGDDPAALYEYSTGDLTFYASAGNPGDASGTGDEIALGVSYGMGNITLALGYEMADASGADIDHIIGGVSAGFGDATIKAVYGSADGTGVDGDQYAVSLDYVFGAATATIFYTDDEELGGAEAYGIGMAYDLGGGAALKAGYVQNESLDADGYDFGITMSF